MTDVSADVVDAGGIRTTLSDRCLVLQFTIDPKSGQIVGLFGVFDGKGRQVTMQQWQVPQLLSIRPTSRTEVSLLSSSCHSNCVICKSSCSLSLSSILAEADNN